MDQGTWIMAVKRQLWQECVQNCSNFLQIVVTKSEVLCAL
jgi:hypothetical protein